jgi:hypothetical protein
MNLDVTFSENNTNFVVEFTEEKQALDVSFQGTTILHDGVNTDDATAEEHHILEDYTAYAKGKKLTGTIPQRDESDINPYSRITKPSSSSGDANKRVIRTTVTVPKGYYGKTLSIEDDTSISVQAGKTVTPSTKLQTAVASGRYTIGAVYVSGDADLISENIRSGKTIFGVKGTYSGKTQADFPLQDITITPSASTVYYEPDEENYGFGKVTVYGDIDLIPDNIKKGTNIFDVVGSYDPVSELPRYNGEVEDA